MKNITLRFIKYDIYNLPNFICKIEDKEAYEQLNELYDKLMVKYGDHVIPLYKNFEYDYFILKTLKNNKYKFKEKNIYELELQFLEKKVGNNENDEKKYINCMILKSKCIIKHVEDLGSKIEL